ncbi:hypothetical protein [Emticicia sp. BO119]|uniref:hypothetical protein n=1 Tax=Emticicia sp. BO119 TaxID=2757768 RepID=UPI0015F05D84|nr:hypothetical protein [Emticicia sp. BO119]MBA4851262.1 hypothetical protein [Emticicia sp. BO119]
MKTQNCLFLNMRISFCVLTLFISVSSASANRFTEDKPLNEKPLQKPAMSKENDTLKGSSQSDNAKVDCQPKNCVPIVITKSKTT